ncbi:uncharacterized protein T551_03637 [Pneumocystis jirovecii RU7]|uniref:Uncharacterized protein n=1 Tax=Pneumocystis jirovecii (strain RU7) TaxID=1408657 RepID=A0A0W4ZCP0_PNEJ7|nr:uncharacterized protein T551_03637 [Pneumocystis jirovecii RU7]KTW26065.1 hypothetical protein T551_03637 [Pneumocystis jirovecii RU7]
MKKRIQHKNQKDNTKKRRIQPKKYTSLSSESISSDHEELSIDSRRLSRPLQETSTKLYLEGFVSLQNDTFKRIKMLIKTAKEEKCTNDHKFKALIGDILALEDEEHVSDAGILKENISSFLSILMDYRTILEDLISTKSSEVFKYRNEYDHETNLAKAAITNAASNTFLEINQNMDYKKALKKFAKAVNLALLSVE